MVPDGQPGEQRDFLPSRGQGGHGPQRPRASTRSLRVVFFFAILVLLLTGAMTSAPPATARDKAFKDKGKKSAEQPYALIYGTVWSAQGTPVYGVPVRIRRVDEKKARWQLVSNHLGEFAQRVPAGTADYVVWAEIKQKGKDSAKPELRVHIENDERVDISLHLIE